jgi:ABC-type transporter Mla maintaining outer membrane lipid asymmetry permease subunit MlaE
VRRVFARITVLWGVVNLVNAGVTIVLLVTQSVPVYVAAKTGTSLAAVGVAIAISAGWFFSVLRHHEPVPVPVALRQPVGAELA